MNSGWRAQPPVEHPVPVTLGAGGISSLVMWTWLTSPVSLAFSAQFSVLGLCYAGFLALSTDL